MKFNHLNVPTHWRNYWSRYPEGHTILEALISWVSQVDSMVDNQNKLNDNVEQFRIEIDEFVERFDERLQDEVTQTLKDWQTSGFLDVVISEALQWQLDDYIATNEQDKLSLTAQLEQKATKHRSVNAKIATNLNFYAGVYDNLNAIYAFWLNSGVEKVIFTLHLAGARCLPTEDMVKFDTAVSLAKTMFVVDTLKFHCTEPELDTNTTLQTAYATSIHSILDDVGGNFTNVIVLNERADVHNNTDNQTFCLNLVNAIKARGFTVGVSFQGSVEVMTCIQRFGAFMNTLDIIGLNCYPSISSKMKATTTSDSLRAWRYTLDVLTYIKNKFKNKKVVISETGILPYWEMLTDPWIYLTGGKTLANEKVPILFLSGLLESDLTDNLDEIWFWFMEAPVVDTTVSQVFDYDHFASYITSKL